MQGEINKFILMHPESIGAYYRDNSLLFIVSDAIKWHDQNIKLNNNEYVRNTFYNRNKISKSNDLRYGVVGIDEFTDAMQSWDSFRIPSLFTKEIDEYKSTNGIRKTIKSARSYALYLALLENVNLLTPFTILDSILRMTIKNNSIRKKYIEDNIDYLTKIYHLDEDTEYYKIYKYDRDKEGNVIDKKYIMVDYNRLFEDREKLLPKSINEYFYLNNLDQYSNFLTCHLTRRFINAGIYQKIENNTLNNTYNDNYIKDNRYNIKL